VSCKIEQLHQSVVLLAINGLGYGVLAIDGYRRRYFPESDKGAKE
jgi:hypothetical protein